jgi:preprotein translocase subunit SecY
VINPGIGFTLQMILMLTTGAIFVMWLGEQITERGIGNGMSLLIFFSIIEAFPNAIMQTVELVRIGEVSVMALVLMIAVMVAVITATIAVTMASRKIPVQIPRKVMGRGRVREGQKSFVPLRLNSAGVMPIIFAQSIIIVPGTLATFSQRPWIQNFSTWFAYGSTAYYVTFAILIIFFTYFYTSIIFNPVDLAENLKKQGAFVPGVKPGARTAEYIDRVLTRISLPGSLFLAAIAIFPFMLLESVGVPFLGGILGGTGLLIVVGVGLDTVQQMQQHLLLRHYDGFMKRGRVKFRGRQRYM